MEISVFEIAQLVEGTIQNGKLDVNQVKIKSIAAIDHATEGSLTFLYNHKYNHYLYTTKAAAVLVEKDFQPDNEVTPILIRVENVYSKLINLFEKFNHKGQNKSGIEPNTSMGEGVAYGKDFYLGAFSYLGKNVRIGNNVKIFPQCYIGDNTQIGDNSIVYSGVKIYDDTEIGKDCIIHSGAVIGSDGFGFIAEPNGIYRKIPQVGRVILKDRVEIGANTVIDRATIESTIINEGVKLDNLIQIAHNVEIGENTVIAAQTGVSGSTKIGKRCIIAGQVGFVGHIDIADGSLFGARSGVSRSVTEPNQKWFGVPSLKLNETLRIHALLKKLPEIYNKLVEHDKLLKK